LRFNAANGCTQVIQTHASEWILSDDDDLAVFPIDLSTSDCKGTVIPDNIFLTEEISRMYEIGPGDETFMVGRLISHDGRQKNTPVVRFGNISMMPIEPIRTRDGEQIAFLVECRSLSGFSGSPVYAWIPAGWRPNYRPFQVPQGPWLLGINCGHITLPEMVKTLSRGKQIRVEEHSAIEVVIPAWRLQKLLNREELVGSRLKIEKEIEQGQARGFVAYDTLNDLLARLGR
jgi:hypothetical protein